MKAEFYIGLAFMAIGIGVIMYVIHPWYKKRYIKAAVQEEKDKWMEKIHCTDRINSIRSLIPEQEWDTYKPKLLIQDLKTLEIIQHLLWVNIPIKRIMVGFLLEQAVKMDKALRNGLSLWDVIVNITGYKELFLLLIQEDVQRYDQQTLTQWMGLVDALKSKKFDPTGKGIQYQMLDFVKEFKI